MKRKFLFIIGLLLLLGQSSQARAEFEFVSTPSGPAPILEVQWYGVDTTGEDAQSVLGVRIENVSDIPWIVDVSVECMGLIQHAAELDLGVVKIAAQEAIYLEVNAIDLPLKSQDYIMQARVNAEVELERPNMDPVIRPTYSDDLFYRHARKQLKKVFTFSQEILSVVYGGQLAPVEPPQSEIGWVMVEPGYYEPVYATDFAFLDDNGEEVIAHFGGATAFHSGSAGGFGDTIPHDPQDPYATAEIKFCANWLTGYIDADVGEDYLVVPYDLYWTYRFVPASYAMVRIRHEDGTHIWYDYLDENGCTPYLNVASFTEYTIEQWASMQKDSGWGVAKKMAVLQHSATAWEPGWAAMVYSEVNTGALVDGSQNTINIKPGFYTAATHVAPVAALALKYSTKMAYPDGMETYISTRLDEAGNYLGCGGTYSSGTSGHVCIVNGRHYWKYVIAHELGHRVGYGQGAWNCSGYQDGISPNYHCNCDHLDPLGNGGMLDWHCLQSREGIKTAECEGWAHVYATMLFNQQGLMSGDDAAFVYYKAMNDGILVIPPMYVDAKDPIQRMDTNCSDDMTDNGTEQDWLVFLTTVWQDSAERFSAQELIDVSAGADYSSHWIYLVESVEDIYDDTHPKYWHFVNKGGAAGVNH